MSDYTPTTETVRNGYVGASSEPNPYVSEDARAEFDRWLADVKAQAWQEDWDTKPPYQKINNPYRQGEEHV